MKINKILSYLDKITLQNKIIFLIFFFLYLLFSFSIIDQYSNVLNNPDLYRYFLGDGASHIARIDKIDKELNLNRIHPATYYFNNYYIFPATLLKFLKVFFGYNYSLAGISAVIVNLLSIFFICVYGYLICFNISKSKIFSLGIILLIWHGDLIKYALRIYPDILQLAFMFAAVYYATSQHKFNWLLSFVFCGLAFGVKAQGLLITVYLLTLFFFMELSKHNFKINDIKLSLFKTFLYALVFLGAFFILNQIDPIQLLKEIFSVATEKVRDQGFDNSERAFRFLTIIFREKSNIVIFLITICIGYTLNFNVKKNKILFLVTLIFLLLFYYQASNNSFALYGPRYLYHLLPLIILLLSISLNNISNYFCQKKLKMISLIFTIIIFGYGLNLFKNTFFKSISIYNFKDRVQSGQEIEGYNFLKTIRPNYDNPLVCAGRYSLVPRGSQGYRRVRKSDHLDYEKIIRNKKCNLVILDQSTPGVYIWFDGTIDNIIIKKYENLSYHDQGFGKDKIEKTQQLIKYILTDLKSGYEVIFYNKKMIVLTTR